MSKIIDVKAREILDSRGNPTVEVDMILENGIMATASVPSGASTGSREALELRDGDKNRFGGKGVLTAIENVNTTIKNALVGCELNQKDVDNTMLKLDGTDNKNKLGANAILGVSLASLKCLAKLENKELYEYVSNGSYTFPVPMVNIINGGAHAVNSLEIQEFMIVPKLDTMSKRVRAAAEVFHALKKLLVQDHYDVGVGDEGGYAPNLKCNEEALDYITKAITSAGYVPGRDIFIAMDAAASEFYNKETGMYTIDNKEISVDELMDYYENLVNDYAIVSIEDPFFEDDFEAFKKFTERVGDRIMVVGDDQFVTNIEYLQKGIDMNSSNAILLKANQIGTVSELLDTIALAHENNYQTIISHRSGETEDTFIADLAVGLNIPYIKTGSMSRGERIVKYNRLMKIEEFVNKN